MSNNLPFYAAIGAAYLYSRMNLEKTKSYNMSEPVPKERDLNGDREVYEKAQLGARYATLTKARQILTWDDYGR